jgi:uncharacterized protein (DUF427 family)
MNDYPGPIVPANHVEPVPRRIRAYLGGLAVLDTVRARYVWEIPNYPQFYVPVDDIRADALVAERRTEETPRGVAEVFGVCCGEIHRGASARLFKESPVEGLSGTVRFDWKALDSWFEEDEQIFIHPRSPYTRVDALRSTRRVRVEIDGVLLAESSSPVLVFETGLPTRYYLNRTDVDFRYLVPTNTITACPYKGWTGGYWSAHINDQEHADVAWCYEFPMRELLPIAGLIAFYNERVDLFLDGRKLERPVRRLPPGR